ncbi:cryptochrome/photolyase family protein [Roseateles sp. NT4]|uniref:cryptochrome/photolyase family protein n=1 Tax=Roseateles sp. NT4 TaxID=3453715 RepID=UPI003EEC5E4E
MRDLVLVLGDQLDLDAAAFDGFDASRDAVWMAEVGEESTHVWSSQPRIALFLAAMRHFAENLHEAGWPMHYRRLDDPATLGSLGAQLVHDIARLRPSRVVLTHPGDWRVLQALQAATAAQGVPLDVREDRHFFTTPAEFAAHAATRGDRGLRMEFFYREQRERFGILMEGREPLGGRWNFDTENRRAFSSDGPGFDLPQPPRFAPDAITREVISLVRERFGGHPGRLDSFAWPLTRSQALQALQAFVTERLPLFGPYQDAMWPGEPWLYHAQLSAALNLKLLNPREVIAAAEAATRAGRVPLASGEGFIRQILGWREYVRGIYWTGMPGYASLNALDAHEPLPAWYWTGETDMACLRDAITQTLEHGYAHHIQRLMVTGLYALLLGVEPSQVHGWYLSVYVDAVEWVELPNTLGMSQYADGGLMASKPYAASGQYIARQSPHCRGCRYQPQQRTGERACPFTTLYVDFLVRHETRLSGNPRMTGPLQQLRQLPDDERRRIRTQAAQIREDQSRAPSVEPDPTAARHAR